MSRNEVIAAILENMNLTKRAVGGRLHAIVQNLAISPAQLEMLYMIQQLQPVSTKTLAHDRQMTPGAISQLTDMLVQKDYVLREADAIDRRTHTLRVTKAGDKVLLTIQKRREELFKRVMHNFDDDELAMWLRIQKKMIREIEIERDFQNNQQTKGSA